MESVAELIERLRDADVGVRDEATDALIARGVPIVPDLIAALGDHSFLVRMRVAQALGAIGDPTAVPPLIRALVAAQVGEGDVAEAIRRALKNLAWTLRAGNADMVRPLTAILAATVGTEAGAAAAWALGQIARRYPVPELRASLPFLRQALEMRDLPPRRDLYQGALAQIEEATTPFKKPLMPAKLGFTALMSKLRRQEITEEDIPALIELLRHASPAVRDEATEALIVLGAPAVPRLIEALKDRSYLVRMRAARALGGTGDARAIAPLIALFRRAANREPDVASAVAEALGEIAQRNPVPELRAALPALRPTLFGMDPKLLYPTQSLPSVQAAVERIEKATAAIKDLPMPAERITASSVETLPLPANAPAPTAEGLPIPSPSAGGDPTAANPESAVWWQRLRHWLRPR